MVRRPLMLSRHGPRRIESCIDRVLSWLVNKWQQWDAAEPDKGGQPRSEPAGGEPPRDMILGKVYNLMDDQRRNCDRGDQLKGGGVDACACDQIRRQRLALRLGDVVANVDGDVEECQAVA